MYYIYMTRNLILLLFHRYFDFWAFFCAYKYWRDLTGRLSLWWWGSRSYRRSVGGPSSPSLGGDGGGDHLPQHGLRRAHLGVALHLPVTAASETAKHYNILILKSLVHIITILTLTFQWLWDMTSEKAKPTEYVRVKFTPPRTMT